MVPGAGVEPARCYHRGILSPLRLPVSPPGRAGIGIAKMEAGTRFELVSTVLQTAV